MEFKVQILGFASATPLSTRFTSSQVVSFNQKPYLIDCGEGTQILLRKYKVGFSKIDQIFISHLHGDHIFGLVGLLSSFHLLGRKKELTIFCPKGLDEIVQVQLKHSQTILCFDIDFVFHEESGPILLENKDFRVSKIRLNHRIACWGFIFEKKNDLRPLIKGVVEEYKIPYVEIEAIKKGKDFKRMNGEVIPNQLLTKEPNKAVKYAYCSDNRVCDSTYELLAGVDYIYHEATFLHDLLDRAKSTFHSTAKEVGELCQKLQPQKVLLGHFSARYTDLAPILEEVQAYFPKAELAEEGGVYIFNE